MTSKITYDNIASLDNIISKDNIAGGDYIKNLMEHLTNPTRVRIFMEICQAEQTVKSLLQKLPEISQPTMYRHISALQSGGIIKVSAEKKVRGVLEKSYTVNEEMATDIGKIVEENDGLSYYQLFIQYITAIAREFENYSRRQNINIVEDVSAFATAPFYATGEEVHQVMAEIWEKIIPLLQNEATPDRQLRSICTIVTPPKASN